MRTSLRYAAVALLVLPLLPLTPAAATPPVPPIDDVRELRRKHLDTSALTLARRAPEGRVDAAPTPAVGTVRQWVGLDDLEGSLYRKDYTLRGVGTHIEVWVANDLGFPAGDCRPASSTEVTDQQVTGLITEFDETIYPRETAAFSVPAERDGTDPLLTGDYTGDGGRTVTLVDNVRDDNYHKFPDAPTYIAGFFSAQINELLDRNVMTIDAFDWKHRSGPNPPNDPTDDLCTSRPARPHMYEATFAHEWQHLLQSYTDGTEDVWVNEGLSDYAQSLVGYSDGTATVYHPGSDVHLSCFQGFGVVRTGFNTNPRDCGGPQNSLNLWNEGTAAEVLADYGNTFQFMLYLRDRFGAEALSRLHRDGAHQGLAGVAAALGPDVNLYGVIHDFQTMTLVDKVVGETTAGVMVGVPKARVTASNLRSTVNLANPAAYEQPGAAPNGADYVRLRDTTGGYLTGDELTSAGFSGARVLPPRELTWTVRDGALFSGDANNLDAAAIATVTVPEADPVLRLRSRLGAELGYDYAYVTVSTDGGKTYSTLAGSNTVEGPLGPGLNGRTSAFEDQTYDLSGYAGKRVLLGFRYVSDSAVNHGGWLIDDITVGKLLISDGSALTGMRSPTQINPVRVYGWNVRLIGLDEAGDKARSVPVAQYAKLRGYPKVAAIVSYDEPTGSYEQYAPYRLTVNGVLQPGGGSKP